MKKEMKYCLVVALGLAIGGCSKDGGHKGVQLWRGGPYWAETNIGAGKPWECGCYFWWGDTTGHRPHGTMFSISFDAFADSSNCPTYGKSIKRLMGEGWIVSKDGIYVLAPEQDAAHVYWGGEWRMPTKQEFEDLITKCDWFWTTVNGVKGYVIHGRGDYSSVSIFLPAAGYGLGSSLSSAGSFGVFWSSVPSSVLNSAWELYFSSSTHGTDGCGNRLYHGHPVRPVQGFTK